MNEEIIKNIYLELGIKEFQVNNTLKLLSEGSTIPFIARYRKEATGNLDENEIEKINEVYTYQVNLLKRKEDVIRKQKLQKRLSLDWSLWQKKYLEKIRI